MADDRTDSEERIDLLVVGGGINGCGIARDAAGRGLKVLLCEKDDLAQHTSSASTKLIHGGLRYLEHYEFRLVREALTEREVLWQMAPHIIWPMRFVLPYDRGLRPAWMLRLGLFLYDHIGGRKRLPATRRVDLHAQPFGGVLQDRLTKGFEYSDCWVEDARLVALNAMDARDRGATVLTRTACTRLERRSDHWRATLAERDGSERVVQARAVANAAGPWVDDVAGLTGDGTRQKHVRLVQGSHIIIRRKYPGEQAFIFQNGDGRIVFAIPYERDYTLIGTTDRLYTEDLDAVRISEDETDYLLSAASEYFAEPVSRADIVSTYSGVRPLFEDHSSDNAHVTRDYVLDIDAGHGQPPILSVYGGKITTYRRLAEHAMDDLAKYLPEASGAWTRGAVLPGGDIPHGDFPLFERVMQEAHPSVERQTLHRLLRAYGTRAEPLLAAPGPTIAGDVTEAELTYLAAQEFARTGEDVLWRRSKLGLHLDAAAQQAIADWMTRNA